MAKLYMMVGLPASGKSTYAQYIAEQENAIIHSSDSLREELFGDVNENSRNDELFRELHNRIKADLMICVPNICCEPTKFESHELFAVITCNPFCSASRCAPISMRTNRW